MTDKPTITLSPDDIARCEADAAETMKRVGGVMPLTRDSKTYDQLRDWLASRKEAGRQIDIATCEVEWWYAQVLDPYGIREMLGEEVYYQVGRDYFVRSPESNRWIWEGDLPADKAKAMRERIEREARN